MSISIHYDKEAQKLLIKTESKLLAVLDAKEASNFKKEYENAFSLLKMDYSIEENDYAQIIMEDFDAWMKFTDDDDEELALDTDIMGLNIEVRWMTRLGHSESSIRLLKKNGGSVYFDIPDNLERNFSDEQVMFGQASSRQIRRCFDENVLNYIKERPDFLIKFCDVYVPHEYLLSDEKEMFFDFEESMDT